MRESVPRLNDSLAGALRALQVDKESILEGRIWEERRAHKGGGGAGAVVK